MNRQYGELWNMDPQSRATSRAWIKMLLLITIAGLVAFTGFGITVWVFLVLDPAPNYVGRARMTVDTVLRAEKAEYDYRHVYKSMAELQHSLDVPIDGCDTAYCYSVEISPGRFVIRAWPTRLRQLVCWATRAKWPTFYADHTGVVRVAASPQQASVSSPAVPAGRLW